MKKEIRKFIEITRDNLEKDDSCGGWCIRCSLANAMGDKFWDDKDKTSDSEAIRQVFTNNIHSTSKVDFLCEETREYLKKKSGNEKMVFKTKKETLAFLDKMLRNK
ncbi:MAG: hypothetical protein ABIJ43_04145 [Candidatus Beckwithbacteria bacterium]|uniref:Uncharacterized protein n=1 Tax=viral metagenome TaxID=1070528 RepID=A0A6H2A450_9ZZZZ